MRQIWADDAGVVVGYDGGAICAYDHALALQYWYDGPAEGRAAVWRRLTRRAPPPPLPLTGEVRFQDLRYVHHGDAVQVVGRDERWLAAPTEAAYEGWDVLGGGLAAQPLGWSGPPGAWSAQARLWSTGPDCAGVTLRLPPSSLVSVERGALDGVEARVQDGALGFGRVALDRNRPVLLTLSGRATGSARVRIPVSTRRHHVVADSRLEVTRTEVDEVVLGELTLDVAVEVGRLQLVRPGEALALDGAWVAALSAAGALDAAARAPDLGRWLARALARCRVAAPEQDPDAVLAEWLRLSERDRAATGPGGIPAYKLATGQGWIVAGAELDRIRAAFGPEHPLSRFAAGGAFEVRGDAPPYSHTVT